MSSDSVISRGLHIPRFARFRVRHRGVVVAGSALLLAALGAAGPGYAQQFDPIEAAALTEAAHPAQDATLDAAEAATTEAPPVEVLAPETPPTEAPAPEAPPVEPIGTGVASWYGKEFSGRRTASGERFDPTGYTAAHRSLPFGSKVRVTHKRTGKAVVVRINDRGPFSHGRLIDLSHAAASELGIVGAGSGEVSLALLRN